MTIGNAKTRRVNPLMVGGVCLFPESNNPESVGVSTISSMTTEDEGVAVTWPRCFSKCSSHSFFYPTDIALQLVPDWVARGHKLATI